MIKINILRYILNKNHLFKRFYILFLAVKCKKRQYKQKTLNEFYINIYNKKHVYNIWEISITKIVYEL